MPDDSTDDPDRRELEARIEQLEATVAKMLPSRRDVLKTGAGIGVGAAGVYAATGGAAGQTGPAGQQG
ncbi:MAG: hypothetical protein RI560_05640, partial [Natronomonas sp.]|nr:hypothetical protein [Natronomonas sp.]